MISDFQGKVLFDERVESQREVFGVASPVDVNPPLRS